MRSISTSSAGILAELLLFCATTVHAHSWVEQLRVIAANGTFVGVPGYQRAYFPRVAGNNMDDNLNKVPPDGRATGNAILTTDPMCKNLQTVGSQSAGSPVLETTSGDQIALRYLENGHVTKPDINPGKPAGRGTVYIYGTSQSANSDTYLGIHHVWNTNGTGGDGRGVLLATRPFDDGQCYEANASPISTQRQAEFSHVAADPMGANLWCQSDVQVPTNVSGTYSLYWVWEWPTLDASGNVVTNESYTSCMDINVTPGASTNNKGASFIKDQDRNFIAIQDQLANQFLVEPTYGTSPAPAPAASDAISATTSTPARSSDAAGGAHTVTVTQTVAKETIYVTVTTNNEGAGQSSNLTPKSSTTSSASATVASSNVHPSPGVDTTTNEGPKSSATVLPLPSSISDATSASPVVSSTTKPATPTTASSTLSSTQVTTTSGAPIVSPFLAPNSSIITRGLPITPRLKPRFFYA